MFCALRALHTSQKCGLLCKCKIVGDLVWKRNNKRILSSLRFLSHELLQKCVIMGLISLLFIFKFFGTYFDYSEYNRDLSSSGITGHVICCGHIGIQHAPWTFLLEFYHEVRRNRNF